MVARINSLSFVIFDCDGVLVDSETLAAQVFARQLANWGVDFSAERCFEEFKGYTLHACLKKLVGLTGRSLPESFLIELQDATFAAFAADLKPVQGIVELLDLLQSKGIEFCVASNGGVNKIRYSLTHTGLVTYFVDRLFSAEHVKHGKPRPDLFLHAAQVCHYAPQVCWVVEDSSTGVEAAMRAQMNVIYYRDGAEVEGQQDGVVHIRKISEINRLVD